MVREVISPHSEIVSSPIANITLSSKDLKRNPCRAQMCKHVRHAGQATIVDNPNMRSHLLTLSAQSANGPHEA